MHAAKMGIEGRWSDQNRMEEYSIEQIISFVDEKCPFVLTSGCRPPELRAIPSVDLWALGQPQSTIHRMWPVQTLTLLLCLTDEEQLYARIDPPPAVIEAETPAEGAVSDALLLDLSTIGMDV